MKYELELCDYGEGWGEIRNPKAEGRRKAESESESAADRSA